MDWFGDGCDGVIRLRRVGEPPTPSSLKDSSVGEDRNNLGPMVGGFRGYSLCSLIVEGKRVLALY